MRIILIGFMGSGKSTLAKKLASRLGYLLCDMDAMIEEREECTISTLFATKGEAYFRKLESQVLETLSIQNDIVVATGGGTPCNKKNSAIIKKYFTSVFLDVNKALLLKRLKSENQHRPLLANSDSFEYQIETLLEVRKPFYNKANYVIEVTNENQTKLLDIVLKKLGYV